MKRSFLLTLLSIDGSITRFLAHQLYKKRTHHFKLSCWQRQQQQQVFWGRTRMASEGTATAAARRLRTWLVTPMPCHAMPFPYESTYSLWSKLWWLQLYYVALSIDLCPTSLAMEKRKGYCSRLTTSCADCNFKSSSQSTAYFHNQAWLLRSYSHITCRDIEITQ